MHIRCIGVGVPFVSTCNIVGGLFSRVGESVGVSTVFISFVLSRLCERLPIRRRRFVSRFDQLLVLVIGVIDVIDVGKL